MQRELEFVQHVLQPYFSSCCCQLAVATAAMVHPPPALLNHLTANGQDLRTGVVGLLMDDSSVLRQGGWTLMINIYIAQGDHGWRLYCLKSNDCIIKAVWF
jgi:hypothetical protein